MLKLKNLLLLLMGFMLLTNAKAQNVGKFIYKVDSIWNGYGSTTLPMTQFSRNKIFTIFPDSGSIVMYSSANQEYADKLIFKGVGRTKTDTLYIRVRDNNTIDRGLIISMDGYSTLKDYYKDFTEWTVHYIVDAHQQRIIIYAKELPEKRSMYFIHLEKHEFIK